jgi:hypothetical protein
MPHFLIAHRTICMLAILRYKPSVRQQKNMIYIINLYDKFPKRDKYATKN